MKKTENTADEEKRKSTNINNWINFFKWVIILMIIVLVWALFGANFMYFKNLPDTIFEKFIPTDNTKVPYGKDGGGNVGNQNLTNFLTRFGLNNYSVPYNLKDHESDLYKWFSRTMEFSYLNGRKIISSFINFFKSGNNVYEFSPFAITLAPIFILLLIGFTPLLGIFLLAFGSFMSAQAWWSKLLVIILFVLIPLLPPILGFISTFQMFQILGTFLIVPLLINRDNVFSIIKDHKIVYLSLFGLLVSLFAFFNLGIVPGITMAAMIAFLIGKGVKDNIF